MAISSTRVKFLDKENKVLVKPIKDFVSNEIFSDFVTSFLDTDLVSSFLGQQNLLNLQSGLSNLSSFLSDLEVSKFSIDTLLSELNFTAPELSHLGAIFDVIKGMDDKTSGLFMSSLLEVATDKLIDNPSLVNSYRSVTGDVKTQTLLSALDVFSTKLAAGDISTSTFARQLNSTAGGAVDLGQLNTVLNAIKANTKTIDLNAIVDGDPKLAESFLDGLTALIAKEEEFDYGLGVINDGEDLDGEDGEEDTTTVFKVTDPDIQNLLVAYLSVKRVYVLAYLDSTVVQYQTPEFLAFVQTTKGKEFLTGTLAGDVKVAPAYQSAILVEAIAGIVASLQTNAASATPMTVEQLTALTKTLGGAIDSTLDYVLVDTKKDIDTSFGENEAVNKVNAYIKNPAYTTAPTVDFPGFYLDDNAVAAVGYYNRLVSTRLLNYLKKPKSVVSVETIGGAIAYTQLQIIRYLLKLPDPNLPSIYSAINIVSHLSTSIFNFNATEELEEEGFELDAPLIAKGPSDSHLATFSILYNVITKSTAMISSIDSIPLLERPLYTSLRKFVGNVDFALGNPSRGIDYDSVESLLKIYTLFKDSKSVLDNVRFANNALEMERISVSADEDTVIIV